MKAARWLGLMGASLVLAAGRVPASSWPTIIGLVALAGFAGLGFFHVWRPRRATGTISVGLLVVAVLSPLSPNAVLEMMPSIGGLAAAGGLLVLATPMPKAARGASAGAWLLPASWLAVPMVALTAIVVFAPPRISLLAELDLVLPLLVAGTVLALAATAHWMQTRSAAP